MYFIVFKKTTAAKAIEREKKQTGYKNIDQRGASARVSRSRRTASLEGVAINGIQISFCATRHKVESATADNPRQSGPVGNHCLCVHV